MASSYGEGKQFTVEVLEKIKPKHAIDVGPGCGTYWAICNGKYGEWIGQGHGYSQQVPFKDYTGEPPRMVAIEAYMPYISMYSLNDKYADVYVADARVFNWDLFAGKADVLFFGDILEHMKQQEADDLFHTVRSKANNIIISLPIIHFPQGAIGGNIFEVHHEEDWTHERVLDVFGEPKEFFKGSAIGGYWYDTNGN